LTSSSPPVRYLNQREPVATNEKKRLVRQVPRQQMVADWIAQAKTLKPVVTY